MRKASATMLMILAFSIGISALTVKDSTINGLANKLITWTDSKGKERNVGLRTSGPLGVSAYMTYYNGATKVIVAGSGNTDPANSGFGGIIHHNSGGVSNEKFTVRWVGASMAIFDHTQTVDATLETITYTFMDGHDYFQYAVTDDCRVGTGIGDTRTPYCSIDYSGGRNLKCEGLEYGAQKYFKQPSLSELVPGQWNAYSGPYTFSGTCDIPYAWEWAGGLEIGFVQSQTYTQQNAGTPAWSGGIPASGPHMATYWSDTTGGKKADPVGITDYQMNFYDNYSKITWGQPMGYMNATNTWNANGVAALKNKWGQYSLSILVDSKADSGVMRIRDENRATHTAHVVFTATTGTVKTQGPTGTVNPALQTLSPVGYDHNFRAWWVDAAANNQASVNLTVSGSTPLLNPTFRVSGMTALPTMMSYNGATITSGTGYYASFDSTHGDVWLTVVGSFTGSNLVGINLATPVLKRPPAAPSKPIFKSELIQHGNAVSFTFFAPASGRASLCLYDQAGRLVATVFEGVVSQGVNTLTWLSNRVNAIRSGCFVVAYSFEGRQETATVLHARF